MKKTLILISLFFVSVTFGNEARIQSYLELLNRYPQTLGPFGQFQDKEIEIIRDPKKIAEIEIEMGRKVGIIAQDRYWIWINDAVKFPSGKNGIYGRLLWVKSLTGSPGVAVMALLPDKRIVLNCNYRHATRSWELELPRGTVEPNESLEQAAKREVKEETGMVVDALHLLGEMTPDTGLTNTIVPIYMAKVTAQQKSSPEESEAIASILALSQTEIEKGFLEGFMTLEIAGKKQKVHVRDPFLAFALFTARLKRLGG